MTIESQAGQVENLLMGRTCESCCFRLLNVRVCAVPGPEEAYEESLVCSLGGDLDNGTCSRWTTQVAEDP